MSLIEITLEGQINKVDVAINRIKSFDPIENGFSDEPYYVAYSGGKDSDVLRILFALAGVKHDLVHNHTTVDAPETVRYVRGIPGIQVSYPELSIWALIVKNHMPPTRLVRYCCAELKERGGQNRFVATGVRWEESTSRHSRGGVEILAKNKKDRIALNADNDDSRRLFETCALQGKRVLNPIIDWTLEDVWEFLHHYNCLSNPLYQCGYSRVGCVGCPMAQPKQREREFDRYPKYKENYIRAFGRMIKALADSDTPTRWKTGDEVFDWWMAPPNPKEDENQIQLDYGADEPQEE